MTAMDPFLALMAAFVAALGACVGSFLNVCIWRIPRDESVIRPASHCPHCNRPIPWYLNIPVVSWLALGGRCRYCRGPIAVRYILVELLTAALFLAVLFQAEGYPRLLGMRRLDDWLLVPVYCVFTAGLVLGTFVDFEHQIIPDSVTWGGLAAGLALSPLVPAMHDTTVWYWALLLAAVGGAAGFGLLWLVALLGEKVYKQEAMGFGDVKLMGAIGAFLGWKAVLFTTVAASLAGSVVGLTLIALKRTHLQGRLPFGPYLALAALVWIYWGPLLWQAYFRLLGRA
jgi:leader peptidase (prepilin peptidase)/N-methyltransferase